MRRKCNVWSYIYNSIWVPAFATSFSSRIAIDIPTTLTVWDLWTDPVGVAALLDVWGEKLGGPRAGV